MAIREKYTLKRVVQHENRHNDACKDVNFKARSSAIRSAYLKWEQELQDADNFIPREGGWYMVLNIVGGKCTSNILMKESWTFFFSISVFQNNIKKNHAPQSPVLKWV